MIPTLFLIARWIGLAHDRWREQVARRRPLAAEVDALREKNEKLRAENDLLRARLLRLDSRRRPHFTPWQRVEVLWHQARYGLSIEATARAFIVSIQTLVNWRREVARRVARLVQARPPLNRLSDLVEEIARRLKREWPTWGSRRIASILARLGIKASRTSVQRVLRRGPRRPAIAAGTLRAPRMERITNRLVAQVEAQADSTPKLRITSLEGNPRSIMTTGPKGARVGGSMTRGRLSPQQAVALRKQIRSRLNAGEKRMAVARDLARKYGITPAAVTWHARRELNRPPAGMTIVAAQDAHQELNRLVERDLEIRRSHARVLEQIDSLCRRFGADLGKRRRKSRLSLRSHAFAPGLQTFGSRLRELRLAAGWTLDRVARAAGTNKSYLSWIERGRIHPPPGPIVERLARTLSTDPREFLLLAHVDRAPLKIREDLVRGLWSASSSRSR
jgi:hypothetical protein